LACAIGKLRTLGVILLTEELGIECKTAIAGGATGRCLGEAVGVVALAVMQWEVEIASEANSGLEVVTGAEDGHLHAGSS
jgi:hypothetical protein